MMETADVARQRLRAGQREFGLWDKSPLRAKVNNDGLVYFELNHYWNYFDVRQNEGLTHARIFNDWLVENFPNVVVKHHTRVTVGAFTFPVPTMCPAAMRTDVAYYARERNLPFHRTPRATWEEARPTPQYVPGQLVCVRGRSPRKDYYYAAHWLAYFKNACGHIPQHYYVLVKEDSVATVASAICNPWELDPGEQP